MNFVFCVIMFYIQVYSAFRPYVVSDHNYGDLPISTGFEKNTAVSSANLQLNIFDKMLSEEMLSIKQHFHEKESSHTPSVRISVQALGPTPTLEVKQKWPIENLFMKSRNINNRSELMNDEIKKITENFTTTEPSTFIDNKHGEKNESNSALKDKVLELRSLPETRQLICECMKTNPEATCTQLCTGIDFNLKPTDKEGKHECTRTEATLSYTIYPIYVTYPSYFWGNTYTENPYYHPNPMNEIKLSKTKKRRKNKKPRPIVGQNYDHKLQDSYYSMENENSIGIYDGDEGFDKSSSIDNLDDRENAEFIETDSNKLEFVDKDSFVNDIVDDLKQYYGNVVIKDCYCSLSSRNYTLNVFMFYSLVTSYTLLYF